MAEILHLLHINAPAPKVYQAITEQKGLQAWWTNQTIAEPKVDAIIEFKFGELYHDKMRITELDANHRVEWLCLEGDPEWIETTFEFELEAKADKTILRFKHANWKASTDFFANCNYHWGYYLRSLKLYCETGKGTPFTETATSKPRNTNK